MVRSKDQHPISFCALRYGESKISCGGSVTILGSFRGHFVAKKIRFRLIAAARINCNFRGRPNEKELQMPYAVASDNVRLYFEEAGSGTPIILLHEFAADHTNWEPQMRYFSRGHRCIAYSARGYTPSDVPPSADVYTYKHFYTDALAVLDHLKIAKAHFVGLSMGSYSSLQIGLNAPERALSLTLAAVGSGSSLENLEVFRKQCRANAEQYETIGSAKAAKATREAPRRIAFLLKDPRGHADFYDALARHDSKGSANTM